jgi:ElaB/YqjD/DUF883 family membrane-anchored ribosome-binding protein
MAQAETHAEQLERETEQARAEIANTLDELRACMTPGHILDQFAERMNAGATAAFARNLRDQAVNNPLPVTLIGTGLAWLMLGGRGGVDSGAAREATERASSLSQEAVEGAIDSAGQTADALRDTADSARQAAGQAADALRGGAGAVTDTMKRTAATTKAAGQRTLQSGSALVDFCREQPLVLAGIGVAMGALIGALLPATDAENRLMGETSDRLKARTQDLASQQVAAAKEAMKQTAAQASEPEFDTSQEEAAHALDSGRKAADWKDDAKEGAVVRSDEPTLAPKGPDETRGQPWSPENAPL